MTWISLENKMSQSCIGVSGDRLVAGSQRGSSQDCVKAGPNFEFWPDSDLFWSGSFPCWNTQPHPTFSFLAHVFSWRIQTSSSSDFHSFSLRGTVPGLGLNVLKRIRTRGNLSADPSPAAEAVQIINSASCLMKTIQ